MHAAFLVIACVSLLAVVGAFLIGDPDADGPGPDGAARPEGPVGVAELATPAAWDNLPGGAPLIRG